MRQPLFSNAQKLGLFPGGGAFRLAGEGSDMIDGQDGGGYGPGEAEDRADDDHQRHN